MNLSYCPRCGKLFARGIREVCIACTENIEKEYEKVVEYLRKYKSATIYEVSEATGVSMKQVTKFIREGRISTDGMPNLSIACEVCGQSIREGNMCASCRSKLQRDIRNVRSDTPAAQPQPATPDQKKSGAFQIRDHT